MSEVVRQTGGKAQNIRVFARVRPFNDKEDPTQSCILSLNDKTISIKQKDAKDPHQFTFDGIFESDSTQGAIYEAVGSEIVAGAFQGLNGTIFCYGQTSSGKTFTCVGPDFRDEVQAGILPRLIKQTLKTIEQSPKNIESKMKISMVQIYNQKIKDLLDLSKTDLKIRSNKKQGIFLQNLTQKYILSQEEAFTYLSIGIGNRSVGVTNMNSESSRSHMVFIISLSTHDVYSGEANSAKVILVDLAGSEKISKTGAEGKLLEEAKKINTSLTALGKVINALSDGKSTHIPYRDSKLTRFLQQSLGGNSLTNLIVNVSPSSYNEYETLTSFRFGQRAKSIKNEPIVNKCFTADELLILLKKAQQTIQRQNLLIKELSSKKRSGGYGALTVPSMITLHLLPDDQSTQKSIDCDSEDAQCQKEKEHQQEIESENVDPLSKGSMGSLKSQEVLKLNLNRIKERSQSSSWLKEKSPNKEERPLSSCSDYGNEPLTPGSKKENESEQSKKSSEKLPRPLPMLIDCSKIQSTIYQDAQQSARTQNNSPDQSTHILDQTHPICEIPKVETPCLEDRTSIEYNLDKIRNNLFQLKLRYMQEKRENSIKSLIIERKNRIIEKNRGPKHAQFVR